MTELPRRAFLASGAAAAMGAATPVPIIDCHIHLFDQTRPQGAPYSGGGRNTLPSLPARYRKLAQPLGIAGAIVVEASPWIEDNLWALQVMEPDGMMLGLVGNLQPEKPEFREYLERYHRNRLFLGIRHGNIWGYSLTQQLANPVFVDGLKLLEQAGLSLDTANPRPDLLEAVLKVKDRVPGLRVIVDHLPALFWPLPGAERQGVEALLRELARRPGVYVKISAAMRVADGKGLTDAALYQSVFDLIFDTFGQDRLIFGSDWPNADAVDNLPAIVQIAKQYFGAKSQAANEKFFWRNSIEAYRWQPREAGQPAA
jgi:predicted TIM-barrel fold metal-dependent hydrolase